MGGNGIEKDILVSSLLHIDGKQSRALSRPSYISSSDSTRTSSRTGLSASETHAVVSTKFGSYRGCLVAVKMLHTSNHHVEVSLYAVKNLPIFHLVV